MIYVIPLSVFYTGNVVCPGFFEEYLSTGSTAGTPPDSTDGYAYDIAINLQILNYLQIINSLDRDTTDKALTYMKDSKYISGRYLIMVVISDIVL